MQYPSLLRPTTTEIIRTSSQTVEVPKVELLLRPWQGAPLADTFGGKPLIDFGGQPLFAELCVYELFRLSGWEARWVETYGAPATRPNLFTTWQDVPRKQQQHQPLPDGVAAEWLKTVAAQNKDRYGGCWDVLGWHGEKVLFAELKRRKKDRLQTTQPVWLEAGLQCGLQPDNFLLVEWDFASNA